MALGIDAIAARVVALAASLREQLARLPGLTLHDQGVERCGIVTFTIDGVDAHELAARLRTEGINISVSTIDFARYDFEARGLEEVARASVHYYNTDEELSRLVEALHRYALSPPPNIRQLRVVCARVLPDARVCSPSALAAPGTDDLPRTAAGPASEPDDGGSGGDEHAAADDHDRARIAAWERGDGLRGSRRRWCAPAPNRHHGAVRC